MSAKKKAPVKGQSSLFSFFKKKSTSEASPSASPSASVPGDASSTPLPAAPLEPAVDVKKDKSYVVVEDDKSLFVGRTLRVYWPNEKQWYSGKIESFDSIDNTHKVVYEDGDSEDLCLDKEQVTNRNVYDLVTVFHL